VIYADNHTGLAQASIYSALNSAFSLLKSLLLSVFQAISYQQQLATISQVISSGLFSYWNFDEGSGNIAQDISGNGNTLNLNNNPNWIDGKINKAISFNGVDQYGSVASLNLSNTNQVSISFWGILSTDSRSVVYELTPNYNQFTTGLAMFINDTPTCNLGQVSLVVKGDDGYNIKCYNLPTDRVWHHYVAIYDKSSNSANEVNLYIDNVLQAPSSQPYYADNTNNFSNSPFYLMSREGIYRYTNGSIDDLRIYNRLLSASDINSLYSLGSGTTSPPPVTDTTPPSTPTNLTATPISSSQINLSWTASTDNVGVASYRLERCQGSSCTSFTQIATPTGTTYSDTGLSANTSYNYRVRAADAANNLSGYSNTASATTFSISTKFSLNDRVQTTAVLNVRATPSLSGNLLGTQTSGSLGTIIGGPVYADGYWWWNVNYDTGFDGWSVEDYLEKYTVGSNTYTLTINALNGTVVKNPNQDSYPIGTVVTLTAIPNSEYVFSKWSGSLTGTANPITITMDSNKTITANFSLKSYVLTINALNGSVAKSPSKSYYLSGEQVTLTATPNSGYHFVNWSGDLTESINPIVITMDSNKTITANFALNSSLASPQNLTAEVVATNKVRLRWQDTANDETNYLIERAVAPTGPFVVIKTLGANYKTYTDTVPVPGVTYYYRVYAFNSVGKSDYSNVISVTVTPPIAPILLSVISKTPTQVALTWQDNSDNENGFKIEQRRLGSNYTTVATLGPNVTTYIRSSLSSKTTYYFRIRAYNGAGYSSYSNEISITTP
jgi:uncharacterized repeat protein (TIGR02543 family)